MNIVVTGSIAFDYLMSFPGKFTEHFLPEHMSRVSLSFLVDTMDKRRGGCAPNIAYTLALLGERPRLMATAGQDFGDYRRWLEAAHVDTSLVQEIDGKFTASFFCSTDVDSNQIASFYTGAMANCRRAVVSRRARLRPGDHLAERSRARCCSTPMSAGRWASRSSGTRVSSARACRATSSRMGWPAATIVICNDYEFELIRQKTGLDEEAILARSGALVVTRGENGCSILERHSTTDVPAVPPHRIVDPTGVGDAFRGGFLKGMARGASYRVCAQIGSVAATYALEHLGGQSHAYSWPEFLERYEPHFGHGAGL